MFHHVARSVPDRLLWCRDTEGIVLFRALARTFPELVALCVMPDHVHLVLPHADPDRRLYRALAGYACHLGARRGRPGPLWSPHPPAEAIPDEKHLRRTVRYVHLNPCRAGLAADPLAWPLSTHRDRVGFAAAPALAPADDPAGFHRFVSADGTVATHGSPLPTAPYESVPAARLAAAVAGVFRVPEEALFQRTPARRAFVRAAAHLGLPFAAIERATGLTASQRWRLARGVPERGARVDDPVLSACVRAAADARFVALSDDDHRRERRWSRYAHRG